MIFPFGSFAHSSLALMDIVIQVGWPCPPFSRHVHCGSRSRNLIFVVLPTLSPRHLWLTENFDVSQVHHTFANLGWLKGILLKFWGHFYQLWDSLCSDRTRTHTLSSHPHSVTTLRFLHPVLIAVREPKAHQPATSTVFPCFSVCSSIDMEHPLELGLQTAMSCHVNRTWVLWKSRQCSHCWTTKLSLQPDLAFRYIAPPGKHEFQSALCPLNKVVGNIVYLSFLFYLLFCGFFFFFFGQGFSESLEHVLELVLVDQAGSLKLCLLNAGIKEACM